MTTPTRAIGIDIGGTKVAGGVVDENGEDDVDDSDLDVALTDLAWSMIDAVERPAR